MRPINFLNHKPGCSTRVCNTCEREAREAVGVGDGALSLADEKRVRDYFKSSAPTPAPNPAPVFRQRESTIMRNVISPAVAAAIAEVKEHERLSAEEKRIIARLGIAPEAYILHRAQYRRGFQPEEK